jgi:hypothetical protein
MSRMDLDEFDSDEDIFDEPKQQAPAPEVTAQQQPPSQQRSVQGSYDDYVGVQQAGPPVSSQTIKIVPASTTPPQQHVERLSESPVHISPVTRSNPPPLMVDTSSQEEERSSPRSTPSPELIEHEDQDMSRNKGSMTTSSSSTATPTWNDASLRAFFESGSDIRDLLVVVYDKTDVEPVGPDHPVAGNLFKEENIKLAEITTVSPFPPLDIGLKCVCLLTPTMTAT